MCDEIREIKRGNGEIFGLTPKSFEKSLFSLSQGSDRIRSVF